MDRIDIRPLMDAILDAIWIQWRTCGTWIEAERIAISTVDPEALLLMSLTLEPKERRLSDILASWAWNGSRLFSIQRVKNLLRDYPEITGKRLTGYAWLARSEGKDFRWRSLAGSESILEGRNHSLWRAYPSDWHPAALILRLRLGLGVGVGSDLLSFLISLQGEWASARLMAQASSYSVYSVRRAADQMAAAQLIERTRDKPVQYRVSTEAWGDLLFGDGISPIWRFWQPVYAFAARLISKVEDEAWEGQSAYMQSTRLRDLVEEHQEAFALNHLSYPDPRRYPGEAYLSACVQFIQELSRWIRQEV